jgi:hypothetical protein
MLINAALQIDKVTAVATSPAHGQIVDLEGFVYLAQDLAGANQDELRYDLADGWRAPTRPTSTANNA